MVEDRLFWGAGALRAAYEGTDWADTPLGPVTSWSPALRGALSLALATPFPICLFWGPSLVMVYNEAYTALIGQKHPGALGAAAEEVFPEVWDDIGPLFTGVLTGSGAVLVEDARLPLVRRGFLEECFFTFAYSPVTDDDGEVVGVLDIATETTRQVVDRRRLELLSDLGQQLRGLQHPGQLAQRALPVLRAASLDLPDVDVVAPGDPVPAWCGTPVPDALGDGPAVLERPAGGRVAWLPLPGAVLPAGRPALVVHLNEQLALDSSYLAFLGLVAGALGSALSEAAVHESERRAALAVRSLSEAMQSSLLTSPPQPDDLRIAVRYLPAARHAQVGGDWYDAFTTSDGATSVVVGDVAGHDQQAAVAMGQFRNLLRGIGYTLSKPPAAVLSALDRAVRDLEVGALATALLAVVEQGGRDAADGVRTLRWSNAGHLPPLLVRPDGCVEVLASEPDLLLGLDAGTERTDHSVVLQPGDTVLLVTDGLVERRGAGIDDGVAWLAATAASLAGLGPEQLCDALLAEVEGHVEDDVALLALRAGSPPGATG